MKRNTSLDGARGLAALSVALAHCCTHIAGVALYASTAADFKTMDPAHIAMRLWHSVFNGDAAVILFFALSGYVLGRSLEKMDISPARAFGPYVVRRAFRLLPVSIVAGALAFALFPITIHQMIGAMFIFDQSANGVLWSLQVEVLGSLVIFGLWALDSRVFVWLVLAVYAYLFWKVPMWAMIVSSEFVMLPAAFVLGYAIPMIPGAVWRSRWLLVAALATLLLSDLFLGRSWNTRIGQLLGAFALVGCLQARPVRFLDSKPVQFLGEVSYPFYLIHALIAYPVERLVNYVAPNANFVVKVVALAATSVPPALLLAFIVTTVIEKPGIRAGSLLLSLRKLRDVQKVRGGTV